MLRRLLKLGSDCRGGVSPLMVLMLLPIVGFMSLGAEASFWFMTQRALQNAADSAVLAAATNGDDVNDTNGLPRYHNEAAAVAGEYGFFTGTNNVTITTLNNQACPAPSTETNCYQVTINLNVPLYLTQAVGYTGDAILGDGRNAKTVTAIAVARPKGDPAQYCMLALSETGNSLLINGGPDVDLAGCDLKSNSNLTCHGANADTGVEYGDAVGTSSCGEEERPAQPVSPDPFSALNANPPIPSASCPGGYPQTAAGANLLNGSSSFAAPYCGNVKLTANINITTANTVITIYNGSLDLNGFTLSTSGSGSATLIFTGPGPTNGGSTTYNHYPISSVNNAGILDIQAPNSGDFMGVAVMQDSRLTGNKNNVDMTYTGNGPTLKITGLIYFPNGDFDMRGAINHNTGGLACIGVVAKTITVSGTGAIFDNATSECDILGLVLPGVPGSNYRQSLVL